MTYPKIPLGTGYLPSPNAPRIAGVKQSAIIVMFFDGIFCHDKAVPYMTLRHGKPSGLDRQRSSNFAFLDGHAETVAATDMPLQTRGDSLFSNSALNTNNNGLWKVRFVVKPTT